MLQQLTHSEELVRFMAIAKHADRIPEKWGFRENQRVSAQCVATLPIRQFEATILYLWSDGTATVNFDFQIPFDAERELVKNGRVDLHFLTRISS